MVMEEKKRKGAQAPYGQQRKRQNKSSPPPMLALTQTLAYDFGPSFCPLTLTVPV
jgi:hypothetical protein